MSTTRDPDVILAAWLDENALPLPTETRRAIDVAIRTIPQRRSPWWTPRRNPMARFQNSGPIAVLAVAIIAVVAVLVVGRLPANVSGPATASPLPSPMLSPTQSAGASPAPSRSPSPTPSPSPTTPWQSFTSERFGYTVELPADWTATPPTDVLPDELYPGAETDYADRWVGANATEVSLVVAVHDGGPSESLEEWIPRYEETFSTRLCAISSVNDVEVDTENGTLRVQACGSHVTYNVLVIHGDRAYAILLAAPAAEDPAYTKVLNQILASFRFAQ